MTTLARVGEFAFIEAIKKIASNGAIRAVRVGVGDDAAVVQCGPQTLLSVDCAVDNVHFRHDWISPRMLGRRTFRVAVSDLSAMGGVPRFVLLSLAAPRTLELEYAKSLIRGLVSDATSVGASLVGGNVSRARDLSMSVTVVGEAVAAPILRSGAEAGDVIWVTGTLGDAAAGVELLEKGSDRGRLVSAYRTPPVRLKVAGRLAAAGLATAMIDLSDGFVQDIGHICEASSLEARVAIDSLPVSAVLVRAAKAGSLSRDASQYALDGGESYELAFTSRDDAKTARRIRSVCQAEQCMVTRVGSMVAAHNKGPKIYALDGRPLDGGFIHFGRKR
jgi:thiamine-monophosphate kinase